MSCKRTHRDHSFESVCCLSRNQTPVFTVRRTPSELCANLRQRRQLCLSLRELTQCWQTMRKRPTWQYNLHSARSGSEVSTTLYTRRQHTPCALAVASSSHTGLSYTVVLHCTCFTNCPQDCSVVARMKYDGLEAVMTSEKGESITRGHGRF